MTRTLLLDGDVVAFKAAASVQKVIRWDDNIFSTTADGNEACDRVDTQIVSLMEKAKADKIIVALTDKDNFRKSVWPSYKSKRGEKPMALVAVREYLEANYEVMIRPRLEGDDILGILATHPKLVKGEKVISSIDKDLRGIPGTHLIGDELVEITEAEADEWFYTQVLAGDATDGYPGCPGIGVKRAGDILRVAAANDMTPWEAVVATYVKAKLTEADALVQARCARILHASDYDFKKKDVILWTPPSRS